MRTTFMLSATALLYSFAMVDHAYALYWNCPPVPEFDGPSGVAAISLLLSVGAVLFSRSRSKE